jgi:hypothetical protein
MHLFVNHSTMKHLFTVNTSFLIQMLISVNTSLLILILIINFNKVLKKHGYLQYVYILNTGGPKGHYGWAEIFCLSIIVINFNVKIIVLRVKMCCFVFYISHSPPHGLDCLSAQGHTFAACR